MPPRVVELTIVLYILWTVFGPLAQAPGRYATIAGGVSSFPTMFVGATGPFVAAWLRGASPTRHVQIGPHAVLMTGQHLLKCLAFGIFGFAFGPWLPLALAMILAGFLGTLLGRAILDQTPEAWFRWAVSALLALLAVRLIWRGLTG